MVLGMKMQRIQCLILLMFLVSGCSTLAQKQHSLLQQAFTDVITAVGMCNDNLKLNQSTVYVFNNIIIDDDESTNKYQLLSSTQRINEEMKHHFITYINENNNCRKIAIQGLSKVHPYFVTVYVDSSRRVDNLYGRLLSDEINVGELNRLMQEAKSIFEKELAAAANKIDSEFLNAHNSEVASRYRAAAALQNLSIQQQQMLYNNLNRPHTTNCNMIGNYVNCTSY